MWLLVALAAVATAAPPAECRYDPAILQLGVDSFDQDIKGGWRPLADRPECLGVAADLLRQYREHQQQALHILSWHEGQLRAERGESDAAIALFEQSRKSDDEQGWNDYVDATIAFLRHDRPALLAARAQLAQRPPMPPFIEANGHRIPVPPGPMNLNVVDKFIRHFGESYLAAYSSAD